jgi:hypothetical protein
MPSDVFGRLLGILQEAGEEGLTGAELGRRAGLDPVDHDFCVGWIQSLQNPLHYIRITKPGNTELAHVWVLTEAGRTHAMRLQTAKPGPLSEEEEALCQILVAAQDLRVDGIGVGASPLGATMFSPTIKGDWIFRMEHRKTLLQLLARAQSQPHPATPLSEKEELLLEGLRQVAMTGIGPVTSLKTGVRAAEKGGYTQWGRAASEHYSVDVLNLNATGYAKLIELEMRARGQTLAVTALSEEAGTVPCPDPEYRDRFINIVGTEPGDPLISSEIEARRRGPDHIE